MLPLTAEKEKEKDTNSADANSKMNSPITNSDINIEYFIGNLDRNQGLVDRAVVSFSFSSSAVSGSKVDSCPDPDAFILTPSLLLPTYYPSYDVNKI